MALSVCITSGVNDLFTFSAWLEGLSPGPKLASIVYKDLEAINKDLLQGARYDIAKVSFNILAQIVDDYVVLDVGNTLVSGPGPKIVTANKDTVDFSKAHLLVPGLNTTAYLLTKKFVPTFAKVTVVDYADIIPLLNSGNYDYGLLIHESALVLESHGLREVFDLSASWRTETADLPLPLGGFVVRKALDFKLIAEISQALKTSLAYTTKDREAFERSVSTHSKLKDKKIIEASLGTWVNDESYVLSSRGKQAIIKLCSLSIDSQATFKLSESCFFKT